MRRHVHVQPTAAAVMAQIAAARGPVAVRDVPGRDDRRIVQRYRLVVDRQPPDAPGERHRQPGGGSRRHAGQIGQTACVHILKREKNCRKR